MAPLKGGGARWQEEAVPYPLFLGLDVHKPEVRLRRRSLFPLHNVSKVIAINSSQAGTGGADLFSELKCVASTSQPAPATA